MQMRRESSLSLKSLFAGKQVSFLFWKGSCQQPYQQGARDLHLTAAQPQNLPFTKHLPPTETQTQIALGLPVKSLPRRFFSRRCTDVGTKQDGTLFPNIGLLLNNLHASQHCTPGECTHKRKRAFPHLSLKAHGNLLLLLLLINRVKDNQWEKKCPEVRVLPESLVRNSTWRHGLPVLTFPSIILIDHGVVGCYWA